MKPELIDEARKIVPEVPILVNIISKRVRQLNQGFPPLIPVTGARSDFGDIALRELIEGKLDWSLATGAELRSGEFEVTLPFAEEIATTSQSPSARKKPQETEEADVSVEALVEQMMQSPVLQEESDDDEEIDDSEAYQAADEEEDASDSAEAEEDKV